ncbi:MAG: hypothetical protein M0R02_11735 [Bacteroidales bacterium]|nr:hypothetical protein [Bacteroidales bacterium]
MDRLRTFSPVRRAVHVLLAVFTMWRLPLKKLAHSGARQPFGQRFFQGALMQQSVPLPLFRRTSPATTGIQITTILKIII